MNARCFDVFGAMCGIPDIMELFVDATNQPIDVEYEDLSETSSVTTTEIEEVEVEEVN